ncbi:DUF4267 domain-containing protein [Micromonospora zamorensis]|uniref:DUF4267 domain-containing protein n=1 Tax=Micromonospora zamorensis TaxID=709883 RepID=UPI0033F4FF55
MQASPEGLGQRLEVVVPSDRAHRLGQFGEAPGQVGRAFIGGRFLLVPRAAAAGYGVRARPDGDPAYLTVKGLRDLSYGLIGLALIAFTTADAVAWFMLIVALNPPGDTVVVLRNGGTRAVAFGNHSPPPSSSSWTPPCCSSADRRTDRRADPCGLTGHDVGGGHREG